MLNDIPDDVIVNVLHDENPSSLIKIAQVSKRFHRLANHSSLTLFKHKKEMDAHVHWVNDICLVATKSDAVIKCKLLIEESGWNYDSPMYILGSTFLYYKHEIKPIIRLIDDDAAAIKDLRERLTQKERFKILTPHDQEIITAKTGHTHQLRELYRIYLTRNKEILKFNVDIESGLEFDLDLKHVAKKDFDRIVKSMNEDTPAVINSLKSKIEYPATRPIDASGVIFKMSEILAQAYEKKSFKLK